MEKKKVRGKITVDRENCKGCYLCISFCPNEVISISGTLNQQGYHPAEFKEDQKNGKGCIACGMCALICPDVAIEVYRE